jgi:hypothetical protein
MIYSLCTVEVPPARANDAVAGIERTMKEGRLGGDLRACWFSEIGRLNRVLAIVAYPTADAMTAANQALLTSSDPFGVASVATGMSLDAYVAFPGVDFLAPGEIGPVFEVRTYELKHGSLPPTFAAWSKVLAARTALSPLVTVMYAVSGAVPRFMHIWPFRSLNERMAVRADAVKQGVWPPPGGLPLLETMQSEIFLPAPFSPLR